MVSISACYYLHRIAYFPIGPQLHKVGPAYGLREIFAGRTDARNLMIKNNSRKCAKISQSIGYEILEGEQFEPCS